MCPGVFALSIAANGEFGRKGVHRLCAYAVEAHAELKNIVVVFGSRVYFGNALDDLAQRNSPTVVPHRYSIALDYDIDLAAVAHYELVYGIVYNLLEQDIDAVVIMGAAAGAADVHARSKPDVLQRRKGLDFVLRVLVLFCRHKSCLPSVYIKLTPALRVLLKC